MAVGSEDHFLASLLLPLDLRQQQFLLAFGAGNVAGAQLRGEAVAFAIEQ